MASRFNQESRVYSCLKLHITTTRKTFQSRVWASRKEHGTLLIHQNHRHELLSRPSQLQNRIQYKKRRRGPATQGEMYSAEYWIWTHHKNPPFFFFFFPFSSYGLVTRWRTFNTRLSIYNSWDGPVLGVRPNVADLGFLRVANATLSFLLKDYNVHYILWRETKS